jgi:hypothetical protein
MNFRDWMDDEEEDAEYHPPEMTPEIKAWLGNSVIQQPVYHGTNQKFSQFEYQKSQRFVLFSAFDVQAHGFFFTEDYATAKTHGRNIVTAYVKMHNPLLDPRRDKHLAVDRLPNQKEAQIAYIVRHMITRDKTYGTAMDVGIGRHYVPNRKDAASKFDDLTDKQKPYFGHKGRTNDYTWVYNVIGGGGLHWDALDNPQVVASMKKLGYDGTFVVENDHPTGRSIFVPDANQIKIVEWTR